MMTPDIELTYFTSLFFKHIKNVQNNAICCVVLLPVLLLSYPGDVLLGVHSEQRPNSRLDHNICTRYNLSSSVRETIGCYLATGQSHRVFVMTN